MKKQIILFALTLMVLTVSAQTKTIQRQPKSPQQTSKSTTESKSSTKSKPATKPASAPLCPDKNHPHMIDLGLPSGTKWACCNVGANKPEISGDYYGWGETETKPKYDWSTYKHCDGTEETCHDLGKNISGTDHDVAHVKWGGSWVTPTLLQIQELLDNCKYVWTTINGTKGGKFTSKKTGKSIFFPATGNRWDGDLYYANICAYYWAATPLSAIPEYSKYAGFLFFEPGEANWANNGARAGGFTIRPVAP